MAEAVNLICFFARADKAYIYVRADEHVRYALHLVITAELLLELRRVYKNDVSAICRS